VDRDQNSALTGRRRASSKCGAEEKLFQMFLAVMGGGKKGSGVEAGGGIVGAERARPSGRPFSFGFEKGNCAGGDREERNGCERRKTKKADVSKRGQRKCNAHPRGNAQKGRGEQQQGGKGKVGSVFGLERKKIPQYLEKKSSLSGLIAGKKSTQALTH